MALLNTLVQKAKPSNKNYRLYYEKGLYLEVTSAGGELWRLKYRFDGREKRLALGAYPTVGLKTARDERDTARNLLANKVDPGAHRKAQRTSSMVSKENTFESLAREWHSGKSRVWSAIHTKNVLARLEGNIFPWIGKRPITEITLTKLQMYQVAILL